MSGQTTSAALFEQWCHTLGVGFRRIKVARAKGQKRPDYAVRASGFWCIVEIKQIDPSVEDNNRVATLRQGKVEGYWVDPGARLTRPIRKASSQLRKFSHRGIPTVLCLFDATASFHDAPFQVVQAMIGKEALHFEISSDPKHNPRFLRTRHGKDATMTKEDNRSIRAVAVLLRPTEDSLFIDLYHNHFARVRIPDEVANPLVRKQIMPTISSPPTPGPSGLEFLIGPDWRKWTENPDEKFDQVVREALGEPEP